MFHPASPLPSRQSPLLPRTQLQSPACVNESKHIQYLHVASPVQEMVGGDRPGGFPGENERVTAILTLPCSISVHGAHSRRFSPRPPRRLTVTTHVSAARAGKVCSRAFPRDADVI